MQQRPFAAENNTLTDCAEYIAGENASTVNDAVVARASSSNRAACREEYAMVVQYIYESIEELFLYGSNQRGCAAFNMAAAESDGFSRLLQKDG